MNAESTAAEIAEELEREANDVESIPYGHFEYDSGNAAATRADALRDIAKRLREPAPPFYGIQQARGFPPKAVLGTTTVKAETISNVPVRAQGQFTAERINKDK